MATEQKNTIFAKMVKLGDLMNACRDKDLMEAFQKAANGDHLYEIFLVAVNDEVETLISGDANKKEPTTQQVTDLVATVNQLRNTVASLCQTISTLSSSTLIRTLNTLSSKLDGISPNNTMAPPVNNPGFAPMLPPEIQTNPDTPPVTRKYADGNKQIAEQFMRHAASVDQKVISPIPGLF